MDKQSLRWLCRRAPGIGGCKVAPRWAHLVCGKSRIALISWFAERDTDLLEFAGGVRTNSRSLVEIIYGKANPVKWLRRNIKMVTGIDLLDASEECIAQVKGA